MQVVVGPPTNGTPQMQQHENAERGPVPLIVAIAGLGCAVASFLVAGDDSIRQMMLQSGLIIAAISLLYWITKPNASED